jgi:hypothetical protein
MVKVVLVSIFIAGPAHQNSGNFLNGERKKLQIENYSLGKTSGKPFCPEIVYWYSSNVMFLYLGLLVTRAPEF